MITVLKTISIARSQPHLPHVNLKKGEKLETLPEEVLKISLENGWVDIKEDTPSDIKEDTPSDTPPNPDIERESKPKTKGNKK